MSTERAWEPQVMPGGGFDPRAVADSYWQAGNFEAANEMGRLVPDIAGRMCRLTGRQAHGYARIPGTVGDADVAISHGMHDGYPTPLQRYLGGWIDPQGNRRDAERPILKVTQRSGTPMIPLAEVRGYTGGEALRGVLDLSEGAELRVEYLADGTPTLHRHDRPTPVAD